MCTSTVSLTSALDGGGCLSPFFFSPPRRGGGGGGGGGQSHGPDVLLLGKGPSTHCTGG